VFWLFLVLLVRMGRIVQFFILVDGLFGTETVPIVGSKESKGSRHAFMPHVQFVPAIRVMAAARNWLARSSHLAKYESDEFCGFSCR